MRLIDADELIARCGNWYAEEGTEKGFIGTIKQLLDEQPTVDRVERVNPVKPEFRRGVPSCGKCGNVLANHYRNCPWCGYEVNWNG